MSYYLLAIPFGAALLIFVYFLFRAPYDIYVKLYQAKGAEIKTLQEQLKPYLKPVAAQPKGDGLCIALHEIYSGLKSCRIQIEIHNNSHLAEQNVTVDLLSIRPHPQKLSNEHFPMSLLPSQSGNRTVNPDSKIYFDFCVIQMEPKVRRITFPNGASFEESMYDMLTSVAGSVFCREYDRKCRRPVKESTYDRAYSLELNVSALDRPAIKNTIRLNLIPTPNDEINLPPMGGFLISLD